MAFTIFDDRSHFIVFIFHFAPIIDHEIPDVQWRFEKKFVKTSKEREKKRFNWSFSASESFYVLSVFVGSSSLRNRNCQTKSYNNNNKTTRKKKDHRKTTRTNWRRDNKWSERVQKLTPSNDNYQIISLFCAKPSVDQRVVCVDWARRLYRKMAINQFWLIENGGRYTVACKRYVRDRECVRKETETETDDDDYDYDDDEVCVRVRVCARFVICTYDCRFTLLLSAFFQFTSSQCYVCCFFCRLFIIF